GWCGPARVRPSAAPASARTAGGAQPSQRRSLPREEPSMRTSLLPRPGAPRASVPAPLPGQRGHSGIHYPAQAQFKGGNAAVRPNSKGPRMTRAGPCTFRTRALRALLLDLELGVDDVLLPTARLGRPTHPLARRLPERRAAERGGGELPGKAATA